MNLFLWVIDEITIDCFKVAHLGYQLSPSVVLAFKFSHVGIEKVYCLFMNKHLILYYIRSFFQAS